MYKSMLLAGAALLASSIGAVAQSDHQGMNHSSMPHASQAREHEAAGKIVRIAADAVTLAHGPVASAGWPAMTMAFALASPDLAKGFAAGDAVNFRFLEKDGRHVVIRMTKAPR